MRFRPSSASRWLACPGSVPLTDHIEDKTSIYAAEGSVAHSLAEHCLRLELDPEAYVGEKRIQDGYEITIDEAMAEAVRVYVRIVSQAIADPAVEVFIERTTSVPAFFEGLGELYGTADFLAIKKVSDGFELTIIDLKFGAGVSVEAEGNKQLLTYAAIVTSEIQVERNEPVVGVHALIVQPRANDGDSIREAYFSKAQIIEHSDAIKAAAAKAIEAEKVKDKPAIVNFLEAGDHCRWCAAKATCPKLHAQALEAAGSDFGAAPGFESPDKLSGERLLYWLENGKLFKEWLDSIQEHAKSRIEAGEEIPGWKLVESIANRRWNGSDEEIEAALRAKGFKKKDLYETKLVSPAQAEKAAPASFKKSEAKVAVDALTVRPVTGLSLVKADDKRPAWVKSKPEDDFQPVG